MACVRPDRETYTWAARLNNGLNARSCTLGDVSGADQHRDMGCQLPGTVGLVTETGSASAAGRARPGGASPGGARPGAGTGMPGGAKPGGEPGAAVAKRGWLARAGELADSRLTRPCCGCSKPGGAGGPGRGHPCDGASQSRAAGRSSCASRWHSKGSGLLQLLRPAAEDAAGLGNEAPRLEVQSGLADVLPLTVRRSFAEAGVRPEIKEATQTPVERQVRGSSSKLSLSPLSADEERGGGRHRVALTGRTGRWWACTGVVLSTSPCRLWPEVATSVLGMAGVHVVGVPTLMQRRQAGASLFCTTV